MTQDCGVEFRTRDHSGALDDRRSPLPYRRCPRALRRSLQRTARAACCSHDMWWTGTASAVAPSSRRNATCSAASARSSGSSDRRAERPAEQGGGLGGVEHREDPQPFAGRLDGLRPPAQLESPAMLVAFLAEHEIRVRRLESLALGDRRLGILGDLRGDRAPGIRERHDQLAVEAVAHALVAVAEFERPAPHRAIDGLLLRVVAEAAPAGEELRDGVVAADRNTAASVRRPGSSRSRISSGTADWDWSRSAFPSGSSETRRARLRAAGGSSNRTSPERTAGRSV